MQFEKSSLSYLKNLKLNNNRDWFAEHKPTFIKAQNNAKELYAGIRNNLEKYDEIEKFKLFRIYRDVRFSKDKTPYKHHFAGSFSRLGKQLRGGYYLRIRPGESFLAGGFWEPNKEDLLRIRKEIEVDAIGDSGKLVNYVISEHLENAGTHSGDATIILPAQKLYLETTKRIKKVCKNICSELNISGPFNIQFISKIRRG